MKIRTFIHRIVIAAALCVGMLISAGALTSDRNTYQFSWGGNDYSLMSQCSIMSLDAGVYASGRITCDEKRPAGTFGGFVWLMTGSDGSIVASSGEKGNKASSKTVEFSTDPSNYSRAYQALSTAILYSDDGSDSDRVQGKKTKVISFSKSTADWIETFADEPIQLNENGESFGCVPAAIKQDMELDLLSAIGDNGVKGYVRARELTPMAFATAEEFASYVPQARDIPVYAADGVTVLDSFHVDDPNMN